MYSKEESQKIKKDFWVKFSESYPRKWLLYDTKIKDFAFKFYVDNKKAQVALEIEPKDEEKRKIYYEKIESLKTIIQENYIEDIIFERNYYLENGKIISRIWVELPQVSINNLNTWEQIFEFFNDKMEQFEYFFYEYQDYINDLEINT
jgi:DNA replication initiation complex subunit (GINS family)